jgi:hypothetical protein
MPRCQPRRLRVVMLAWFGTLVLGLAAPGPARHRKRKSRVKRPKLIRNLNLLFAGCKRGMVTYDEGEGAGNGGY